MYCNGLGWKIVVGRSLSVVGLEIGRIASVYLCTLCGYKSFEKPQKYTEVSLPTPYFELPTAVSSLPSNDRGKSIALNSAPIRMTSEIRYIHTSNAIATPSDP